MFQEPPGEIHDVFHAHLLGVILGTLSEQSTTFFTHPFGFFHARFSRIILGTFCVPFRVHFGHHLKTPLECNFGTPFGNHFGFPFGCIFSRSPLGRRCKKSCLCRHVQNLPFASQLQQPTGHLNPIGPHGAHRQGGMLKNRKSPTSPPGPFPCFEILFIIHIRLARGAEQSREFLFGVSQAAGSWH